MKIDVETRWRLEEDNKTLAGCIALSPQPYPLKLFYTFSFLSFQLFPRHNKIRKSTSSPLVDIFLFELFISDFSSRFLKRAC